MHPHVMSPMVVVCLTVAGVLAAAQSGPPAADRWSGVYRSSGLSMELTRQGGGYAGSMTVGGVSMPFTARIHGDSLEGSLEVAGQSLAFTASLAGNTLTLVAQDGSRYALERQAAGPDAAPAPASPAAGSRETGIVGEWRSPQGTMRFNADGSAALNGGNYRYTVRDNVLLITASEGTLQAPFTVNGDSLTLTFNGQQVKLTRAPRVPAGAPAGASSGGRPLELAGQWCYQANVNATNGGARSSSSCFVLNPDGTYSYHGLADSYNPYGGATSEASDGGTWSATESSITFNSRARGPLTYRLEKRNHPKTNDPMLVVDGKAFVTYGQKPSWR